MEREKFHASLKGEGATGSIVRGKFPSGLIKHLGGKDGDLIEIEIEGKKVVAGKIISGDTPQARKIRENILSQSRIGSSTPKAAATNSVAKSGGGKKLSRVEQLELELAALKAPKKVVKKPLTREQQLEAELAALKAEKGGGGTLKGAANRIAKKTTAVPTTQGSVKKIIKKK
jgi:hypothetical protein